MSGFNDTMDLERSLLGVLLKSKILLRQHVGKVKSEYFTTQERKFIRECLVRTMKGSKGLLTKNIFDYEVKSRVEEKEHHYYEAEWTLIESQQTSDEPDALLDRLHKAHLGRQLMDIAETMVLSVEKGDIDSAVRQLRNSTAKVTERRDSQPFIELTDYSTRLGIIKDKQAFPEKYLGVKTGIKSFDDRTGGLFLGELTLISGTTGLGKSTMLKQIESGIIMCNKNKNVLHICNEEHLLQVQSKFDAQLTHIPYKEFKMATMTDEEMEKWKRAMEIELRKPGVGKIFIKEVPAFTDATLIEEALTELETRGVKIHVVVIDHLPHLRPVEQAWGEFDEQGKAAADCKELARSWGIAVVTATQAATVVDAKQSKGRRAGDLDVFGSKKQLHVANTHISLTKIGRDDTQVNLEEWQRDVYWLGNVTKNRDGAKFTFKLKHHVQYGYVEEVFDALTMTQQEEVNQIVGEAEEAETQKVKEIEGKEEGREEEAEGRVESSDEETEEREAEEKEREEREERRRRAEVVSVEVKEKIQYDVEVPEPVQELPKEVPNSILARARQRKLGV